MSFDPSDSSKGSRSTLATPDEPLWAHHVREYVIPVLVFSWMVYYLLRHVAVPMYHVGLPTRRSSQQVLDAHEAEQKAEEEKSEQSAAAKEKKKE